MNHCEEWRGGHHLWDYDRTGSPSPETPYPTFIYKCAYGCGMLLPITGLYVMKDCPHDAGYTIDPLSDGLYAMCMRCLAAPTEDDEENKRQIDLYIQRLLWCGPYCNDHGRVLWPV